MSLRLIQRYATSRGIQEDPDFAWWVPYTLRKRDMIVSAVSSRVRKCLHKFGIEIPTSIAYAKMIDLKNGNNVWMDAITKNMTNVGIAFMMLDEGKKAPPGWTKDSGHLVFNVKMNFTRKARWVKDGHWSPDPTTSAYSGVVSRYSVHVGITYAALMDPDVMA